ncbi:MAG: 5-dehydro-4-deoxy-D-glucuronate isomerase [Verrucomicrobiota bacterium]
MNIIEANSPAAVSRFTTDELRKSFLINSLFAPGRVELNYWETDRTIIGSAVPLAEPLILEATVKELAADYFLQRREIGILNLGGTGAVETDGTRHELGKLDCLYAGRGVRSVVFHSNDPANPARFYLLSYPAHTSYPTTLAREADSAAVDLGTREGANERTIYKFIHPGGIQSCQLVMGFTRLKPGSIWNTMPAHTHIRRSEVYLYFDLEPASRVFHFMGEPTETRHLVVAEGEAVLSPVWSIHSGAGAASYSFCWGMGGENQDFNDMDGLSISNIL